MTHLFFDVVNGICTVLAWVMFLTILAGIGYWGMVFLTRYALFLVGAGP